LAIFTENKPIVDYAQTCGGKSTRNAFKIIRIIITDFIINRICSLITTGLRDTGLKEVMIMIN